MKLKEILPIITHRNYKIFIQNDTTIIMCKMIELNTVEEIKNHFENEVLAINDDWSIVIKSAKIV